MDEKEILGLENLSASQFCLHLLVDLKKKVLIWLQIQYAILGVIGSLELALM